MLYRGRWIDRLLPAQCLLCAAIAPGPLDLCAGCIAELPALEPGCLRCGLPLASGRAAGCGACLAHPPRFSACLAAFAYGFPVRELILRFKRPGGELAAGRALSALLAARIAALPHERRAGRVLVPMPLHRRSLIRRGFNQAERIARVLGRELQLPVDATLARREREGREQKSLDAAARRANLRGAFSARGCTGAKLVIVDDVMTTGASADALAGVLLDAGAAQIDVWCLARAL